MTTPGRQRILDGALELFAQRGYAATSMRDLADHLGMKAASLYSPFPGGKDDVLTHAIEPLLHALDRLLSQDRPGLDVQKWLTDYATTLATHRAAVRVTGSDLAVAAHPTVGQHIAQLNGRTRTLLRRHIHLTELQAAGVLGSLWWPLICLPDPVPPAELAALAGLSATPPKPLAPRAGGRARRVPRTGPDAP